MTIPLRLCHCLADKKNKTGQKGIAAINIQQNSDAWNRIIEKVLKLPSMYIGRGSCLYVLVTEINAELDGFICTGRTENSEFQVLPEDDEQEVVNAWAGSGYDVRYHRHPLEYMGKSVTVNCLKVRNCETDVSITLIPWFVVPGRPFPIITYIYAIWHYHYHGKKSLNESAKASGKLFNIESFHKSTVSRSIRAMENIIDISQMDRALAVSEHDAKSGIAQPDKPCGDILERASEILANCPSVEALKKTYHDEMGPLPERVNAKAGIESVLGGIPPKHGQILIHPERVTRASRDTRERPARSRKKKHGPVQHQFGFVDPACREKIRIAFIDVCRHLVLDAAATYHRFLI